MPKKVESMRELNTEEQEEQNQDLALIKAAKGMKQKGKSERLKILNQAGKKNPFMTSTHYEPIPMMLTKKNPSVAS